MKHSFFAGLVATGFGMGAQHDEYEQKRKARIARGHPVSQIERAENRAMATLFFGSLLATVGCAWFLFPSFANAVTQFMHSWLG